MMSHKCDRFLFKVILTNRISVNITCLFNYFQEIVDAVHHIQHEGNTHTALAALTFVNSGSNHHNHYQHSSNSIGHNHQGYEQLDEQYGDNTSSTVPNTESTGSYSNTLDTPITPVKEENKEVRSNTEDFNSLESIMAELVSAAVMWCLCKPRRCLGHSGTKRY